MAILNKDEYLNRLHSKIGDDVSEEALSFLEDMSDTYEALSQRVQTAETNYSTLQSKAETDNSDWQRKYDDLNRTWQERYRHRFYSGAPVQINAAEESEDNGDTIQIRDLFK